MQIENNLQRIVIKYSYSKVSKVNRVMKTKITNNILIQNAVTVIKIFFPVLNESVFIFIKEFAKIRFNESRRKQLIFD